jgi:hypothetical protein
MRALRLGRSVAQRKPADDLARMLMNAGRAAASLSARAARVAHFACSRAACGVLERGA